MKKSSISIIIPALNEERNIKATVDEVLSAIGERFSSYEILIFNDGSSDNTGKVAEELARGNKSIKIIHNPVNMGLGYNYKRGVELAEKDYIMLVPGDNQILGDSIANIFGLIGKADMVIPYIENPGVRPLSRQATSKLFTLLMNFLFNLDLNYYNGVVVHKKDIIKSVPMSTGGFAYQAQVLTRLIKSGHSFVEVGMRIQEREYGSSKAFSLRNIISVLRSIKNLFWEIYFKGDNTYRMPVRRVKVDLKGLAER